MDYENKFLAARILIAEKLLEQIDKIHFVKKKVKGRYVYHSEPQEFGGVQFSVIKHIHGHKNSTNYALVVNGKKYGASRIGAYAVIKEMAADAAHALMPECPIKEMSNFKQMWDYGKTTRL